MSRKFYADNDTLTLAEWRALDPTGNEAGPSRPVTDAPIGHYTDGRRSANAAASATFTDPSPIPVNERRNPASRPVCPAAPRNGATGTSNTPEPVRKHTA